MSDYLRIRIPSDLKAEAEMVFNEIGMTLSEAVRVFMKQAVNCGGLPFTPRAKQPNAETIASFREYEEGKFTSYSIEEFKDFLNSIKDTE